jgi:hypothetical protein
MYYFAYTINIQPSGSTNNIKDAMSDFLDVRTPKEVIVDNEPWTRMPSETSRAYAAFMAYIDLPVRLRSVKRAVEAHYGGVTSGRVRLFERWSSLHMWVDRAAAWDNYVIEKTRDDQIEKVKALNDKHILAAQSLYDKAIQRIAGVDPDTLSPMDALKYLTESIDIERLALGQATEMETTASVDTTEVTFAEMTDKELIRQIVQLRIKRGGRNVSQE